MNVLPQPPPPRPRRTSISDRTRSTTIDPAWAPSRAEADAYRAVARAASHQRAALPLLRRAAELAPAMPTDDSAGHAGMMADLAEGMRAAAWTVEAAVGVARTYVTYHPALDALLGAEVEEVSGGAGLTGAGRRGDENFAPAGSV